MSSLTAPTASLKVTSIHFILGLKLKKGRRLLATVPIQPLTLLFAKDHVTFLSKKFVDWLRYASITQGAGTSSGGFFTGPRSRQVSWISMFSSIPVTSVSSSSCAHSLSCQPPPITELDGTVSGDFFTVLCVGQGFTEDQWMNVYSFSMLRHWLLTYHSVSNDSSTADTGKAAPLLICKFT